MNYLSTNLILLGRDYNLKFRTIVFFPDPSLPKGIAIVSKGYQCSLCKAYINSKLCLDQHLKGNRHRMQALLHALRDNR